MGATLRTAICDLLDIEIPLLAFSHCRDVVAAVTNAGGFGVLGASSHTPEQLEVELAWIDDHVGGRPYGTDIVMPETYEGKSLELSPESMAELVPDAHVAFVQQVLADHSIAATREDILGQLGAGLSPDVGEQLLDVALRHPIKLIANALGVPPPAMIQRARESGVPVAALVGSPHHAIRQVEAGVDIIVAQGTEAGGHCGEITTLVLVPEVIEALSGTWPGRDIPVLAAGGIVTGRQMAAAVALGAAGAWTGSVWLTTHEAETAPYTVERLLAATSRDTVRSRARTGKPSRQLRSAWHDAWESNDSPGALPLPLQSMVSEPSLRRIDALAARGDSGARDLATYWVGQGVGLMQHRRSARDVVREMTDDYLDAVDRLGRTISD